MSAYGTVAFSGGQADLLPPTSWDLPPPPPGKPFAPFRHLVLHHLRLDSIRAALPGLLEYTHSVFAAEVEAGRTYPQEADAAHERPYTRAAFEAYFWAADVFVAVGMDDVADGTGNINGSGGDHDRNRAGVDADVEASRRGRSWGDVLVGFYYVKPNYPGRSSHVSVLLSGI
jgi:hypothetical protein